MATTTGQWLASFEMRVELDPEFVRFLEANSDKWRDATASDAVYRGLVARYLAGQGLSEAVAYIPAPVALARTAAAPAPAPAVQATKPGSTQMSTRAASLFSWCAVLAPRRVYDEEVGDALEVIRAMERAGATPWKLKLKIASTIFWVWVNGVRHLISAILGRART